MIYIHVPYCKSFCIYCDFYSELFSGGCREEESFLSFGRALATELRLRQEELVSDTLYLGGGTPSVLPLSVLEQIVSTLHSLGVDTNFKEFTIEVNPDDIVTKGIDYVRGLKSLGVSRVSMGVQSLDDSLLKWMGRRHDSASARKAYSILREGGISNISVDLIFGISGLSNELWDRTISDVLSLDGGLPEHISAYQLSIEQGSALASLIDRGAYRECGEEMCHIQYDMLCNRLAEAGYHHYEISNFARSGYEAVHNGAYWTGVPYAGFGPGAHSLVVKDGKRIRFWNKPDMKSYLAAASTENFTHVREYEILDKNQIDEEKIMLALRTDSGLKESEFEALGKGKLVRKMISDGLLERTESGRVRIPENKLFVSDSIIVELI